MGRVDVYNLGANGVDVVASPLHLKDGSVILAQNVQKTLAREGGGLSKRSGQDLLADVGAGPVLSLHNVSLVPAPLLDPETGTEVDPGAEMRNRSYKSANQSIPNNTLTDVTFDVENYDVGGLHDTVTNNSRFTIPAGGDGIYLVIGQSSWGGRGASGGRVGVFIYKNNTQRLFMQEETPDKTVGDENLGTSIQCVGLVPLVAGDYLEMMVQQNSGSALNLLGITDDLTSLTIARLFATA